MDPKGSFVGGRWSRPRGEGSATKTRFLFVGNVGASCGVSDDALFKALAPLGGLQSIQVPDATGQGGRSKNSRKNRKKEQNQKEKNEQVKGSNPGAGTSEGNCRKCGVVAVACSHMFAVFETEAAAARAKEKYDAEACEALGGAGESCIDPAAAERAARRLLFSELLPLLALLLGGLLLLRHLWQLLRRRLPSWPTLLAPPLGVLDMVLLVAGGFVVLGEVLMPLLVIPISSAFTRGLSAPLTQGINVFLGYVALAGPPLLILRQQLGQLDRAQRPPQGWLQWRLQPLGSAVLQGARGWLMVLPPVVLSGWLITRLIGDQGGSNPLLEIVLNSQDTLALLLLSLTAVVLAPLFEETIFRGVLLPVLGQFLGRSGGVVVSALVFAVAHLSIGELAPLLVLGLGLGLLRLSTGRLLPCVVMHALWNGVTFLNLVLLGG